MDYLLKKLGQIVRGSFDDMRTSLENYRILGEISVKEIPQPLIYNQVVDLWGVLGEEGISRRRLDTQLKQNGPAMREFLTRVREIKDDKRQTPEGTRRLFRESLQYIPDIINEIESLETAILTSIPSLKFD